MGAAAPCPEQEAAADRPSRPQPR